MPPDPPRLRRVLVPFALSLLTATGLLSAGACATGEPRLGAPTTPWQSPLPSVTSPTPSTPRTGTTTISASAPPSTPRRPSAAPTSSGPTLAEYLAWIPRFQPAPVPEVVTLPHAPGQVAWTSRIPTSQPVAFLTIDDGIVASADAIALMRAARVPVTLFLTTNTISRNRAYFAQLEEFGAVIEGHTVSHPQLPALSYSGQRYEICHATDQLEQWYGRRPLFFRPPYGEKNDATLRAAYDCGLHAAFGWRETVNNGVVRYQTAQKVIQPGDIILMHFRSTFAADFVAALRAIHAAGLVPVLLEDYVDVTGHPPTPEPGDLR